MLSRDEFLRLSERAETWLGELEALYDAACRVGAEEGVARSAKFIATAADASASEDKIRGCDLLFWVPSHGVGSEVRLGCFRGGSAHDVVCRAAVAFSRPSGCVARLIERPDSFGSFSPWCVVQDAIRERMDAGPEPCDFGFLLVQLRRERVIALGNLGSNEADRQNPPPALKGNDGEQCASAPDGPAPPDGFRFNGRIRRGLSPIVYRLVEHLWRQKDRAAALDTLAEPVWQDRNCFVDNSTAGSARARANKFFTINQLPFLVSIKGNIACLQTHRHG